MNINSDLFNAIDSVFEENGEVLIVDEPKIETPEDAIVKCFTNEQKSKSYYQPLLILGLLIFLIVQLLYTNHMYDASIMRLLSIEKVEMELAGNFFDLYDNILEQLKFYTTSVLCEFIAILYVVIRWGFNSSISDLFSELFIKKDKNKKKGNKK